MGATVYQFSEPLPHDRVIMDLKRAVTRAYRNGIHPEEIARVVAAHLDALQDGSPDRAGDDEP